MRITMICNVLNVGEPGSTVDVDQGFADHLIGRGFAEKAKAKATEPAVHVESASEKRAREKLEREAIHAAEDAKAKAKATEAAAS